MQIEIVTIGNEVLSGRTLDTNFAFLAKALEAVSVQVGWHSTVGDSADRIGEALTRALDRADAVVMTGGLGPTPDDMTREVVGNHLGLPLERHDEIVEHIRERARRLGRKLPPSIENQAMVPRGATLWKNSLGTAPGILLLAGDKPVVLLPGVPYEMEELASVYLVPYLRERSGRRVATFTLRTAGVFESGLHQKIGELPDRWAGATLAYLPSFFGVDLRVTIAGDDATTVDEVSARAHRELAAIVAPVVYAEGGTSLEEVVGGILLEQKLQLAVAESCTGGLLAKRVTDMAGSSRYFDRGFVTYSNASKIELLGVPATEIERHGAVSEPVAQHMARGAARAAGVEVGIGITGIAGPDGGTEEKPVGTVFIGVVTPRGEAVRKYFFPGTRSGIRARSAQTALDLARRQLLGLPLDPSLG